MTSHLTPVSGNSIDHIDLHLQETPVERRRLQAGGVYCIGLPHISALSVLGSVALRPLLNGWRHLLVGPQSALHELCSGGELDARQLRAYALDRVTPAALRGLARDMDRAVRPRRRLIILVLPAESLTEQHKLESLLWGWRLWLRDNGCVLLIAAVQASSAFMARMAVSNDDLSGLAEWHQVADCLHHDVRYWRSSAGVVQACTTHLYSDESGLCARESLAVDDLLSWDVDQMLLDRRALLQMAPPPDVDWVLFEDTKSLVARAETARAATVVFACQGRQDVPQLARHLYSLRRQRGSHLKLVICEISGANLRNYDLNLLLSCGATLLLPRHLLPMHFLHFMELIKCAEHTRALIANLDEVLAWQWQERPQVLLRADQFLDYLESLLTQTWGLPGLGVLVALQPVPGIGPAQVLTQLKLSRAGDAATALEGQVYLFLTDNTPEMLQQTLAAVFSLDYQTIITEIQVYAGDERMNLQVQRMRQQPHQDIDWQAECARLEGRAIQADQHVNPPYQPVLLQHRTSALESV